MTEAGDAPRELPFGAHAPEPIARACRAAAQSLGPGRIGRLARSLAARAGGGQSGAPVDLTVFGNQRVRLHPVGNLSEKRVHAGDRWCERAERDFIAAHVREGQGPFVFVDVGANAGLYTLAARALCHATGREFRAVLAEPNPVMLRRLTFNLAASGCGPNEATVLACAISREPGPVVLRVSDENLGASGVSVDGDGVQVEGLTLVELLGGVGVAGVDVLKIDIEGGEAEALAPFFAQARPALWPRAVVLESRRGEPDSPALDVCARSGYRVESRSHMNAMLALC